MKESKQSRLLYTFTRCPPRYKSKAGCLLFACQVRSTDLGQLLAILLTDRDVHDPAKRPIIVRTAHPVLHVHVDAHAAERGPVKPKWERKEAHSLVSPTHPGTKRGTDGRYIHDLPDRLDRSIACSCDSSQVAAPPARRCCRHYRRRYRRMIQSRRIAWHGVAWRGGSTFSRGGWTRSRVRTRRRAAPPLALLWGAWYLSGRPSPRASKQQQEPSWDGKRPAYPFRGCSE